MSDKQFAQFCQALAQPRPRYPRESVLLELIDGEEVPQVLQLVDMKALGVGYTPGELPN